MMKFKATRQQVQQAMALAFNASSPMGMGHLHFKAGDKTADDFAITGQDVVKMDYVQGRMVKLYIYPVKEESNTWTCASGAANIEYQSWAGKYPTYKELFKAAGISEMVEEE